MKQWTPVAVEWSDAHGGDTGWAAVDDLFHGAARVLTVGMLCYRDDKGITLVFNKDGEHVGGYTFIPDGCIVSVTELRAHGKRRKSH